ncbi:MAG: hypothetical protein JW863_04355 [Chitinispirillaceae bacterium]|nr:hypothetical protein [Chitinispirillaceae bacterium]
MDENSGLIKVTIPYKNTVWSVYPLPEENRFGMIAGKKEDDATVSIVTIKKDRLDIDEIPRSAFEPASERGEKAINSSSLFLLGNRIITILDIRGKKEVCSYWGVGNVLNNYYEKSKVVDFERQLILTLFRPQYDDSFKQVINNSYVLTIENLKDSARVKQIPVATLSGDYKTSTKGDLPSPPQLFFGSTFTVYRESPSYDWLCVDNNLEPIEHPLCTILNDDKALFFSETFFLFDMAICEPKKIAALIYRKERTARILLIAWDREQPVIPVPIEFKPPVAPVFNHFSLSPSGTWLYFEGETGVHDEYSGSYLVYLDPTLPNIAFPPIKIDLAQSAEHLTWMTVPEGLIVYTNKKFHYWDLSQFDPEKNKGDMRK